MISTQTCVPPDAPTTPSSPPTTKPTTTAESLITTTTTSKSSLHLIDWATDNLGIDEFPEIAFAVKKTRRTTTDPPGYNNAKMYNDRYVNLQRNIRCDTISHPATTTPSKTVQLTPTIPDNNDNNVTTPTMIPVNDTNPIITNDNNVTTTTTIPVNDYTQVITQRPTTNKTLKTSPSLDPRLLVNTILTKYSFTNIIKENSSSDPTNATTNFIISNSLRPRIQYRIKELQG